MLSKCLLSSSAMTQFGSRSMLPIEEERRTFESKMRFKLFFVYMPYGTPIAKLEVGQMSLGAYGVQSYPMGIVVVTLYQLLYADCCLGMPGVSLSSSQKLRQSSSEPFSTSYWRSVLFMLICLPKCTKNTSLLVWPQTSNNFSSMNRLMMMFALTQKRQLRFSPSIFFTKTVIVSFFNSSNLTMWMMAFCSRVIVYEEERRLPLKQRCNLSMGISYELQAKRQSSSVDVVIGKWLILAYLELERKYTFTIYMPSIMVVIFEYQ